MLLTLNDPLASLGGGAPQPFPTDGLLAYWPLDDLTDSSGNGRTLTNAGGVTFGTGKIGNGAVFDGGQTSYLTRYLSGLSGNFTVSLWMKPTSHASYTGVLGIDQWQNGLLFRYGSQYDNFYLFNSHKPFVSLTEITEGQWSYVTITGTGGVYCVYVNAELRTTGSYSGTFQSNALLNIGEPIAGPSRTFIGTMDSLGIWNRGLTAREVANLYNNGAGLDYPA